MRKRKIFVPPLKTYKICSINNDNNVITDQQLEINGSDLVQCNSYLYKSDICKANEINKCFEKGDIKLTHLGIELASSCVSLNEDDNILSCNVDASLTSKHEDDNDKVNIIKEELADNKDTNIDSKTAEHSSCEKLCDFESVYGNFKIEFSPFSSENDDMTSVNSTENDIDDNIKELVCGSNGNHLMHDNNDKELSTDLTSFMDIKNGIEQNILCDHSVIDSQQIFNDSESNPCLTNIHTIILEDGDQIRNHITKDDKSHLIGDARNLVESLTDFVQEFKDNGNVCVDVRCNLPPVRSIDDEDPGYDLCNTNLIDCEVFQNNDLDSKIDMLCNLSSNHSKDELISIIDIDNIDNTINSEVFKNICGDNPTINKNDVVEICYENSHEIVSNCHKNFNNKHQTETFVDFFDDSEFEKYLLEDCIKSSDDDFIEHSNVEFHSSFMPLSKTKVYGYKEQICCNDIDDQIEALDPYESLHENISDSKKPDKWFIHNSYKTGYDDDIDDNEQGHVGLLDLEYSELNDLHCKDENKNLNMRMNSYQDCSMQLPSHLNYSSRILDNDLHLSQSKDSRWMKFVGSEKEDEADGVDHLVPFS